MQAIGDYDDDGKADVLFQNPAYHLLGTGDHNGKDDVLFRNDAGFIFEWQMDGLHNAPRCWPAR